MVKSVMAEAPRTIEAAVSSGEHAFGTDWRHQVEVRGERTQREILNAPDGLDREEAIRNLMNETTGFDSADDFVAAFEANSQDETLFLAREELTQTLAWALANGTPEQRAALVSGSVVEVIDQLPVELSYVARDVRDVAVEPGVGERVTELEYALIGTPGSEDNDAQMIGEAIKGIQSWMRDNKVGRDDERRAGAMRIMGMLQMRRNALSGGGMREEEQGGRRGRGRPPDLVPPRPPRDGEEEPGRWEERTWDMTYKRFVELERQQVDPRWFAARPPEWYSRMSKEERALIDVRIKLLESAASKREVRNKLPVEKLRGGVVPELDNKELALLWEKMPGFREAMGFLVRDICDEYPDDAGRIFLKLINIDGKMDASVLKSLEDFDTLRDRVARQVAAKRMGIADVSAVREVGTADIEAVSAMWNFLFVGDSIEAWDYYRQLKPTWICSDKLRTAYHLRTKALGKWRIWKASGELGEEGEEEPFVSPAMAGWVLDRLKFEPGFADRILRGDLKEILPDTLAVSMIETLKVKLQDGTETTLALALLRGQEDRVVLAKNDRNAMQVHNGQVQGADFLSAAFKGKQPLDMAKNGDEWIGAYVENTGLIRQVPTIPKTDGTFTVLPCVDRPMFVWSILLNSMGFDPSDRFPLLPEKKMEDGSKHYAVVLRDILDAMGTRSTFDKRKVRELLGAKDLLDHAKRNMGNEAERWKRTPKAGRG